MWHARSKNKMSCMHRDLKPANLMLGGIPHDSVDRDIAAELGVVKIADFGLSKSLAQNINAAKSRSTMDLNGDVEDGMEGHQLERCAHPCPKPCRVFKHIAAFCREITCLPTLRL